MQVCTSYFGSSIMSSFFILCRPFKPRETHCLHRGTPGVHRDFFFLFFIFILKIFRKIYTHFNPIWKIFNETTLNTSFFLKKKWVFRSFFQGIMSSFFLFFSLIFRKRPFFVKNEYCLVIQKRLLFPLFPADFLKKSGIKWRFSLYI